NAPEINPENTPFKPQFHKGQSPKSTQNSPNPNQTDFPKPKIPQAPTKQISQIPNLPNYTKKPQKTHLFQKTPQKVLLLKIAPENPENSKNPPPCAYDGGGTWGTPLSFYIGGRGPMPPPHLRLNPNRRWGYLQLLCATGGGGASGSDQPEAPPASTPPPVWPNRRGGPPTGGGVLRSPPPLQPEGGCSSPIHPSNRRGGAPVPPSLSTGEGGTSGWPPQLEVPSPPVPFLPLPSSIKGEGEAKGRGLGTFVLFPCFLHLLMLLLVLAFS
ncbi:hypothetical protein Taro_004961, partial [Colocasia esculenta]|nr:hypothetical protein [Colocasia esculenta]